MSCCVWGWGSKGCASPLAACRYGGDGGIPCPWGGELAVNLAGIAANLLFALGLYLFAYPSMRMMFLTAANLAVAAFNLLPIGNLDGGAVIRELANHFLYPQVARKVSRWVSFAVLVPIFALAIFLILIRTSNFTLLATCVYLAAVVIWRE